MYARDFWDIIRLAALTICVLARLCWASIGTGGGGGKRLASGLNAYNLQTTLRIDIPVSKQHNMTTYTLKYGPGLGKTLFPVLGDNRTLRMRQPDH